jgi:hypothetical protein
MFHWTPGLDLVAGTLTLPVWAAGAAVALFFITCIFALRRAGPSTVIGALARVAVVVIVAWAGWTFLQQTATRDRDAARQALDSRAQELTMRAAAPGSTLACLEALGGETVEDACEKLVFASAETSAAALSYTAARIALLADGTAYANRRDPSYETVLAGWRQGLETDRFGLVARVLAARHGCDADQCQAFSLLRDSSRVAANLKERAFDQQVVRHAANWGSRADTPMAAATGPNAPAGAPPSVPGVAAVTSAPIFPSAASIPAVSIMNAEPTGSVQQGATAAIDPVVPTPPRRPPPRRPPSQSAATSAPSAGPPPGPPPSASAPDPNRAQ